MCTRAFVFLSRWLAQFEPTNPAPPKIRTERNDSSLFISLPHRFSRSRDSCGWQRQAPTKGLPMQPNSSNQTVNIEPFHGIVHVIVCLLRLETVHQFFNTLFQPHLWLITQKLCGRRNICKTVPDIACAILSRMLYRKMHSQRMLYFRSNFVHRDLLSGV